MNTLFSRNINYGKNVDLALNYQDISWKPIVNDNFNVLMVDVTGQDHDNYTMVIGLYNDQYLLLNIKKSLYEFNEQVNIELNQKQKQKIETKDFILVHSCLNNVILSTNEVKPSIRSNWLVDLTKLYFVNKKDWGRSHFVYLIKKCRSKKASAFFIKHYSNCN